MIATGLCCLWSWAMRQFSLCLAAASILSMASTLISSAANYPTDAYDALYKKQKMTKQAEGYGNDGGVSDYRFVTDGQGRIRIETEPANAGFITGQKPPKTITIFDFPNGETYILLEKQKLAMRSVLTKDASLAPIDEKRVKEMNGKSLGTGVRSSHPCHGWEYELNGVKTETWIADDLKCPIDTFTMNSDGTLDVLHLYKFSNRIPTQDEFNVPRDFKVTNPGG
jgi:hypothetical protein